MSEFGWRFWADAVLQCQQLNVRVYAKDAFFCICGPGVQPGDANSYIRTSAVAALAIFWDLVESQYENQSGNHKINRHFRTQADLHNPPLTPNH